MDSHSEMSRSSSSPNDGLPRVLVIDDSVSIRNALELILRQRPVEVLAVSNGMDGIGAMLEHVPAAVICDYVLPDRDGITLARFVRNHPLLRTVPFFLISGAADAALEDQARESGCTEVLHKPFTPEAVLAAFDRHVVSRLGPRPGAIPPGPEEPAGARILVIDDSMSVRVALERLLVQRGYETTAVSSSVEGLRRLDEGAFDLLISDVVMPDMDGIELVRFIRDSPALRSLPVILVSGLGDVEIEEKGRVVGVDDVVRKPFTAGSLIPKVERLLARGRTAPVPASPTPPPLESAPEAPFKVLGQLRSVAGVEGAFLLDRKTGQVVAASGMESPRVREAAAHVTRLVPLLEELGAGVSRAGLRSGILQYENGFLVLYEAGRMTILVALSDAAQLGLLNLMVQKRLPRILAGGGS